VQSGFQTSLRSRLPLLVLVALALFPLFRDLGGPLLWEDEGDTAAFAQRIVETGLPTAWDGRTFLDSDYGFRVAPHLLGRDFVMIGTPWLPFYVAAASFALLGETAFAARLPFALASLATLVLVYTLVLRATQCRRAAFAAGLVLLATPQFLLYARECRSYGLNMLLTVAVLAAFLGLRDGVRRGGAWLVLAAVLLFHVQILPAALAVGACGVLALAHPRFRATLPALLRRAPLVMALTLPWIALGWNAVQTNWRPLERAAELPLRAAQLGAESMAAVPWLAWIVGLPWLARRLRTGDRDVLAIGLAYVALLFALMPLVLTDTLLLVTGLRYVCGLIPVAAIVTGVLVARASDTRPWRYAALLFVFCATNLAGNALPWLALGESRRVAGVFFAAPREPVEKLANASLFYFLRGLGRENPGTLGPLLDFLATRVPPEDVVVTNFAWDNLSFYTRRRLGFRISPEAVAVRDAARTAGLPAYVFGFDDARWLVWRHAADPLPEQTTFERARAALEARGATLEPVATFREVLWENRPELTWHRFPDVGHPFAPRRVGAAGRKWPDAVAYRIVWPGDSAR
jgi:4-amino-4-deoxy-L-arabinose transferase-like glycosyltransferase